MVDRAERRYPDFENNLHRARRPISFVCVHFSADFDHNIMASPCVHDPVNELIVVDNREGVQFARLGEALQQGIAKARHEVDALVMRTSCCQMVGSRGSRRA